MSAVNVFLYSDAAVVMTDGLAAEVDGSNRRLVHKVLPLAHLHAVIAVRGPAYMLSAIGDTIGQCRTSFDDARAWMAHDLRGITEALRARMPPTAQGPQLHLVGKSEASGEFEHWFCSSDPHQGLDAYTALQMGTGMQPWPGACDAETQCLAAMAKDDPMAFDCEEHGLSLMEGQMRAFPLCIGGFCQLTFVNETEITTRILRRW